MLRVGCFLIPLAFLMIAPDAFGQTAPSDADDLVVRLTSKEVRERRAAIGAAAEARVISAEALLEVAKMSLQDPDPAVQDMAVSARRKLSHRFESESEFTPAQRETVATGLLTAARSGPVSRRVIAVSLLPEFARDQADKTLKELASAEGEDPQVLSQVFSSRLVLVPSEQRRSYLISGLKSPHAAVVDVAAAHLATLQKDYVPALRELEQDADAGLWASLILARWGQNITRPASVLEPLLNSDRPWVRAAAARALTRSGPAELKVAIDSLGHPNLDARVRLAEALQARFDLITESASRNSFAIEQEFFKSPDRAAYLRGVKRHGLKVAGLYPYLWDLTASERSNPVNKPLADAAVVALQDLFRLAAETEAKAKTGAGTTP